jgi:ArsR family transcriptional regulator, arsenate/arsenite/antimonite-responsive transcriptional repressor
MDNNEPFNALADPTRRKILGLLRYGEMTAGAIAEKFDMTKPSMSHHFTVLKEADLITGRREGQQIWYALNTTVVQDLMAWAMNLIGDGKKKRKERSSDDTKGISVRGIAGRSRIGGNRVCVSPSPK